MIDLIIVKCCPEKVEFLDNPEVCLQKWIKPDCGNAMKNEIRRRWRKTLALMELITFCI